MHCKERKDKQLGMNSGTASARLTRDLMFHLLESSGLNTCDICEGVIHREDLSISHIVPWLDSKNPRELFFDIGNVCYRHKWCNSSSVRKPGETPNGACTVSDLNKSRRLFNHSDVSYIRKVYEKGSRTFGSKPLGRMFNVSHRTIENIVNNKTYRDI